MHLVNGIVSSHLPLTDRGVQFGDGVFRTMRKEERKILFWDAHYLKLKHDAQAIGILCPEQAVLERDLSQLTLQDATVKIILTRGNTDRGYAIPNNVSVTRIVQERAQSQVSWLMNGVNIRFADWRLSRQPRLAGIKHLNRLDNIMARQECVDPNIMESLMLDQEGWVIEGIMSNIFVWRQGKLYTPKLIYNGVAGVMRDQVIRAAQHLGVEVIPVWLTPFDILKADALLLTNSLWGVVPVRQCRARLWEDFSLCHSLHQTIFVHH